MLHTLTEQLGNTTGSNTNDNRGSDDLTKHKEDANYKVKIYSIQSGRNWCIFPDTVENIDEHKKQGYQHCHPKQINFCDLTRCPILSPARHNLWLDQETDPAYYHKHEAGQIHLQ